MKKPRKLLKVNIRKKLQRKVEKLWKEYCKIRDRVCQLCGGTNILQVHHIFGRGHKNLFIDTQNGITLCRDCHCSVTWSDTAKEKLRRKIDPSVYDRLYEQSMHTGAFLEWKSISYLERQIEILEGLI